MKETIVSATHARIHFGEVMRTAVEQSSPVVVERSGKPLVVVISVEEYEKLRGRHRQDTTSNALDQLATLRRNGDVTIDRKSITDTINTLRGKRYESIKHLP